MFARIFAALARAAAMLGRGFHFIWDAIEEAAEPITSRLPWMRDRLQDAGDAAVIGGGYALQGAGMALQAPGAVLREAGSILGSVLPSLAATPQGVADGAVYRDDARPTVQAAPRRAVEVSVERHGRTEADAEEVQRWARALRKSDEKLVKASPGIDGRVFSWLLSLTPDQLLAVEQLPASRVLAHLVPERDSDLSLLLPPAVGIRRLDAGPSGEQFLRSIGVPAEERRSILEESAAKRRTPPKPARDDEEAYGHTLPVFGR